MGGLITCSVSVIGTLVVVFFGLKCSTTFANAFAGAIPSLHPLNSKLAEAQEAIEKCEAVTAAGKKTMSNIKGIGSDAVEMAEGASSFLKNADGLTIAIMVILLLVLCAVGFRFFKIYGVQGGID